MGEHRARLSLPVSLGRSTSQSTIPALDASTTPALWAIGDSLALLGLGLRALGGYIG
jgi:hypothetical protein